MQANKIIVHGVKIVRHADDTLPGGYQMVWNVASDADFKTSAMAYIADAAYWPSDNPEYWAKYGSVDD